MAKGPPDARLFSHVYEPYQELKAHQAFLGLEQNLIDTEQRTQWKNCRASKRTFLPGHSTNVAVVVKLSVVTKHRCFCWLFLAGLSAAAQPVPKLNSLSIEWLKRGTPTDVVFE